MLTTQTNHGFKIKINPTQIDKQLKIKNGNQTWYELVLNTGARVRVKDPVPDVLILMEEIPTPKQDLSYSNVLTSRKPTLRAEDCPSVLSDSWSGKKLHIEDLDLKYKGEMLWGHKTAPELLIVDKLNKHIIKDVDLTKISKRR